jgi:hypothetical protein
MLLGAAMGGGSAALMGRDPLKGALLGGLTGGAGAGISTALNATAPVLEGAVLSNAAPALASTATSPLTASTLNLTPSALGSPTLANAAMPYSAGTNFLDVPGVTNFANTSAGTLSGQLGSGTAGILNTNAGIPSLLSSPAATSAAPTTFTEGMAKFAKDPIASMMANKPTAFASALAGATGTRKELEEEEKYNGPLSRFKFNPSTYRAAGYADGGIASLNSGGYDRMVGEQPMYQAMARGGISSLGDYSDYARGGRMLKGPGDGMSDNIPATIAGKRPARLADGEFVIPADVVSHLGNGSTDAGAKQLYAMMDKVRQARTGRKAQGREINPRQYMAA